MVFIVYYTLLSRKFIFIISTLSKNNFYSCQCIKKTTMDIHVCTHLEPFTTINFREYTNWLQESGKFEIHRLLFSIYYSREYSLFHNIASHVIISLKIKHLKFNYLTKTEFINFISYINDILWSNSSILSIIFRSYITKNNPSCFLNLQKNFHHEASQTLYFVALREAN